MKIVAPAGTSAAGVLWRRQGRLFASAIVQLSYAFGPEDPLSPAAGEQPCSDRVPFRGQVDVVVTGHAFVPPGAPTASAGLRVSRGRHVLLRADRALVCPDAAPPAGVVRLPLRALGKVPRRTLPTVALGHVAALDLDGIELETLQVAAADQRARQLYGDERVELYGLHPAFPNIAFDLPGAAAIACVATSHAGGAGVTRPMMLDTVVIDVDAWRCTLTLRAWFPVEPGHESAARLVVQRGTSAAADAAGAPAGVEAIGATADLSALLAQGATPFESRTAGASPVSMDVRPSRVAGPDDLPPSSAGETTDLSSFLSGQATPFDLAPPSSSGETVDLTAMLSASATPFESSPVPPSDRQERGLERPAAGGVPRAPTAHEPIASATVPHVSGPTLPSAWSDEPTISEKAPTVMTTADLTPESEGEAMVREVVPFAGSVSAAPAVASTLHGEGYTGTADLGFYAQAAAGNAKVTPFVSDPRVKLGEHFLAALERQRSTDTFGPT